MKSLTRILFVVTTCLSTFAFSDGHSHSHSTDLKIDHAWARASAPGAPSAGFLTIHNGSDEDDTLLSVDGDFARMLQLHQSLMVDGVMKMQHQQHGIVIPAGESIVFEPGGYHLMFMGLQKNFELGETYNVTLMFKHAGKVELELPVKEAMKMDSMSHDHDHH